MPTERPVHIEFSSYQASTVALPVASVVAVSCETIYQVSDFELRKFTEKVAALAAQEKEEDFEQLTIKHPQLKDDLKSVSTHLAEEVRVDKIMILDVAAT